jgi:signal transduction histidine kinase
VRRVSSELRPAILDDLGLREAIEWHAQQFQAQKGIVCGFNCSVESLSLSQEQSTAVFRIFQEAMTNVLRHAQATRVDIAMEEQDRVFILTVADNGNGITEDQKSGIYSLGILGMHERVHLVGGEIDITGIQGKGTVIKIRIPEQA